jgi:hypothetical protein
MASESDEEVQDALRNPYRHVQSDRKVFHVPIENVLSIAFTETVAVSPVFAMIVKCLPNLPRILAQVS